MQVGISIQICSSAQGFMLIFRGNSGDSPNSEFAVYAKTHKLWFGSGGKILLSRLIFLSLNTPASSNKVFIFKLTIEDHFKKSNSKVIGSKFLPLAQIKSVAFFQGHPVQ